MSQGAHEKAVLYFRRALRLDSSFLPAWTLMGHEYVELKNTAAAVDAYRHAVRARPPARTPVLPLPTAHARRLRSGMLAQVEINPKDYRAWYGLGQTYEILAMPFYALFYYRKATTLRPYDARMWCAMAGCYKQLERKQVRLLRRVVLRRATCCTPHRSLTVCGAHGRQEAIMCYRRAETNDDREGIAFTELARLYLDAGDRKQVDHRRDTRGRFVRHVGTRTACPPSPIRPPCLPLTRRRTTTRRCLSSASRTGILVARR